MAEMPERSRRAGGGTAEGTGIERQPDAARGGTAGDDPTMLMDEVVRRENMMAAQARVVKNRGAAGVDGMTVDELLPFCCEHWARIRKELLDGTYRPQPVRQVEIPKPDGGVRLLGIPTVVDRLIQQAVLQVFNPIFDPLFSESSFGFRPGRGTHDAVRSARDHIAAGHRWLVDLDLEKFLDRVNHDILMSRVARTVKDKRVLLLIRRYLQAGIMIGGLVEPRDKGTPQGGPLSPLLRSGRGRSLRAVISLLKTRIRGWVAYFRLADVKVHFELLDQWVRRKLRCILWRQWKRPKTRARELSRRGLDADRARLSAGNGRGPWWNAGASHMNQAVPTAYFRRLGLLSFIEEHRRLARFA